MFDLMLCNHLNVDSANIAANTKVFTTNPSYFITNKLSLQLEALSNCDNFTVITILYNNDALHGITKITINIK